MFTQALLKASRSDQIVENLVFRSTLAAFFLGVPHRGLHISALVSMVRDQANERLVRDLGLDSQYLDLLHTTFCELFRMVNFRTISIYETKLSKSVGESIQLQPRNISLVKWIERSKYGQMEQDWDSGIYGDQAFCSTFQAHRRSSWSALSRCRSFLVFQSSKIDLMETIKFYSSESWIVFKLIQLLYGEGILN